MLPTPDAYNEAVQSPRIAFGDPYLKSGAVDCNGFGIPRALGGGFAITYRVRGQAGQEYAVRCFHKEVRDLQDRYRFIHNQLRNRRLPFFVEFEYQPTGILVRGARYPVVKMQWVGGDTLGEYLERNHKNRQFITRLRSLFSSLEQELHASGFAHGDLQNGNVIVNGGNLKLVDYDGMFVPGMTEGKGAELGHKHFQHPGRKTTHFGPTIDRFSFIVIDLSLRGLAFEPDTFAQFSSGENILFTANDFSDPDSSPVFSTLSRLGDSAFRNSIADFACICRCGVETTPRLGDFLERRGIPATARQPVSAVVAPTKYIGALPIVDAGSFQQTCLHIGDRVELVGQVVDVHHGSTLLGTPYVFINFGDWKDDTVKLTIWSEALQKLGFTPDKSWVGQWVSATGLVDPVYHGKNRYKTITYRSVGITVTDKSQVHKITAADASWRLGKGTSPRPSVGGTTSGSTEEGNKAILSGLPGTKPSQASPASSPQSKPKAPAPSRPTRPSTVGQTVQDRNRAILSGMQSGGGSVSSSGSQQAGTRGRGTSQSGSSGCLIALVAFIVACAATAILAAVV